MTKKEDSPKALKRREAATTGAASSDRKADLLEVLEEERSRLMKAVDMLQCVLVSMDEVEGGKFRGPYYPSVLETVRDLLNQSIDRLDSVRLKSLLEGRGANATAANAPASPPQPAADPGRNEVKEPPPPKYVH